MKLVEQKYTADRDNTANTYQSFSATMEMSGNRRHIIVEIAFTQRWRSTAEYADYLRWVADEVEKLPG